MLTKEQRAEGLTLLAKTCTDPTDWPPENADMIDWLWDHKDALLAEPPTIDVEAIKREAVREFAESMIQKLDGNIEKATKNAYEGNFQHGECRGYAIAIQGISAELAARGVKLDEKP